MYSASRVVVTGMGCVTAAGNNLRATLNAIDEGRRNASPSPFPDITPASPVFQCGEKLAAPEFAEPGVPLSRTARLAFVAAYEALVQSGYSVIASTPCRLGVCLGTSVGASLHFSEYYKAWYRNEPCSLSSIHTYRRSNPSLALARLYKATGPVQTVVNACSSGADAIGLAASWLRQGLCDIVIAGGADALSDVTCTGFSRLMITSPEPCRPFDAERAGLNIGEGAGVMILEREADAKNRGARVLGRFLGYGTATDSFHLTAPHPDAKGLAAAYAQVFAAGDVALGDIAFINAHGTATRANDQTEGAFFTRYFPRVPFVATKGATGHTLGAAGAVEAVLTLAHLARGYLPASPGFLTPDPETGARPVSSPLPVNGVAAASQSLAFGGNNSVLVFGKGEGVCA
ncbi:beta-ketoacyl-[acyl-carrier-protein] synthase family protein [Desulfovibrio sp. OttesenSCG-928-O18]|nr:beta-ketoacyl-[acyl-carrier-protein] synthase family protein [Desulfovibrio sp. OttesenSCG-928-O18]